MSILEALIATVTMLGVAVVMILSFAGMAYS
jgi:hypothetical protein